MGSQVIPVRLDKEVLEMVDKLVKIGVFSSRSEALREIIKTGLRNYERMAKIAKAVDKLVELEEKENKIPIRLKGGLRELLEERKRR